MTDHGRQQGSAESEFDDSATSVIPATSETDEWDDQASGPDSPEPARGWAGNVWRTKINLKPVPVILIVLILLSGGTTAWLYAKLYRPDQQVDASVARAAVSAASDGTVALLSYSSDTLDKDIAAARTHLGGDFLDYYNQFTQQFVVPGAKQKALKTTAKVMRAAVSELHPGSAVVLVFVDQSTTTKDTPEPTIKPSSVLVSVTQVNGKWLITKFNPV